MNDELLPRLLRRAGLDATKAFKHQLTVATVVAENLAGPWSLIGQTIAARLAVYPEVSPDLVGLWLDWADLRLDREVLDGMLG